MPRDYSTKAAYDAIYYGTLEPDGHPSTRDGVKVNYSRYLEYPWAQRTATELISILGLSLTGASDGGAHRIVLIGSGFGWTLESLVVDHGWPAGRVVGIDTSAYVQGNKAVTEEAEIRAAIAVVGLDPDTGRGAELLARGWDGGARVRAGITIIDEALTNNGSRRRARQAVEDGLGGAAIDFLITEHMLEGLTDNEATVASSNIDATEPQATKAHIVTTTPLIDPTWNIKSLADWRVLLPNDVLIDGRSFEHLP